MPGGVELLIEHKVVIVEGNYMLNYDDPLWSPLKELFDEKVFLTIIMQAYFWVTQMLFTELNSRTLTLTLTDPLSLTRT